MRTSAWKVAGRSPEGRWKVPGRSLEGPRKVEVVYLDSVDWVAWNARESEIGGLTPKGF